MGGPLCMHTSFTVAAPPLYCVGIMIGSVINGYDYNGSILRIYKLGVLTTTHLYNNGFLLMMLVYAQPVLKV